MQTTVGLLRLAAGTGSHWIYSGSLQNSACSEFPSLGETLAVKCQAMQRIYAKKKMFLNVTGLKLELYF